MRAIEVGDREIGWPEKLVTLALVYGFIATGYFVCNALNAHAQCYTLETSVDRAIPFTPAWVWVYVTYDVVVPIPILLTVWGRGALRRIAVIFICASLVEYAVFLLYPTTVPRPTLPDLLGPSEQWLRDVVWRLDLPYNAFPSQHISHSYIAAFATWRHRPSWGPYAVAWATMIALSTLFIKQHWFLDIAAGFALAALFFWLVEGRRSRATR